ncbi:DUF1848 domain-containing protein [Paenibacillus aceti]|uniref:DUF1848 domain-containing protein n=1 Tax=Paenibacillus aceti TaxID=1820010 RepID=A0ABQ1VV21_9BACL|nr:DUF1848 domain-containing protein [Paenibacillus aceti]GGG00761.1 hypothetical protein GCM10010913_23140 [Paenibacillus aceti]
MIISASRRTDIPAFFGDWFMKRIEAGYFHRVNPFNTKQVSGFSLKPEDVDMIVFWTKNPRPFMRHLATLDAKGYNYYFQFTLNDYPSEFEPNLPTLDSRVEVFQKLSRQIGADRVIWRYDPIIISSLTPVEYHLQRIETLAQRLNSYTHRLVISFMDFYGKTENKIKKQPDLSEITFMDITKPEYETQLEEMARQLSRIGHANGMEVETCAEAVELAHCGIRHGSCIDGRLISNLLGREIGAHKDKNQRGACLCVESVDVGVYNTCRFNCMYCYAVQSEQAVEKTLLQHDPDSPSLIYRYDHEIDIRRS